MTMVMHDGLGTTFAIIILAATIASAVLLAVTLSLQSRSSFAAKILGFLALALVAVQAVHTFEHIIQVTNWARNPLAPGWMSSYAHRAAAGLAQLAEHVQVTGTAMGMELLHLFGNVIFMICAIALWRTRGGSSSRILLRFQALHVLEHITLTVTAATGRPAWGASTLFGQLSGAELTTFRIWWHFTMNAIGFLLALLVLKRPAAGATGVIGVRGSVVALLAAFAVSYMPVIAAFSTPAVPGYPSIQAVVTGLSGWLLVLLTPLVVTMAAELGFALSRSRK